MKKDECKISTAMEDYLRIIFVFECKGFKPSVTSIAKELNVKKPTVTHAFKVLKKAGYVDYTPYGDVKLTERGRKIAENITATHDLLLKFFNIILGVSLKESEREACLVEHCLSKETVEKLTFFVKEYLSKKNS